MKNLKLAFAAIALTALFSVPAMAADGATVPDSPEIARAMNWAVALGVGLGAGLTILGAGYGISLIGSKAVESMARQPEVATNIQGAMIVSAALIEGATFFSLIVVMLILILF